MKRECSLIKTVITGRIKLLEWRDPIRFPFEFPCTLILLIQKHNNDTLSVQNGDSTTKLRNSTDHYFHFFIRWKKEEKVFLIIPWEFTKQTPNLMTAASKLRRKSVTSEICKTSQRCNFFLNYNTSEITEETTKHDFFQ